MWDIPVRHEGLHKYRVVKGYTQEEAALKAVLQEKAWDEQWARVLQTRKREQDRLNAAYQKEQRKALAEEKNAEAEATLVSLETLLKDSIGRDHRVDWPKLKQKLEYPVKPPNRPELQKIPDKPVRRQPHLQLGFVARLIPSIRAKREAEAQAIEDSIFGADLAEWERSKLRIDGQNNTLLGQHDEAVRKYDFEKESYIQRAQEFNEGIEKNRLAYLSKTPEAITEYCETILNASAYPEGFPSSFDVEYIPETRTLVVEFSLPAAEDLPTIKGYKYVATRDEIQPIKLSDAWLNKAYDSVLYKVTLRTLHELFQADSVDALDSMVFNGWVNSVDKATGKEVNACILTVHAKKTEILELDLDQVDPKACFKKLKGVSAAKLINLSPVRPILQLNKDDKRFVPAHNVVDALDDSANLAAMDWEDFEHLIREVFEKEFSANGSQVKITQASRDGGVDAVAFDEDPIRGGKIVIQAKRYTNTVSVSAVRDLYGTIMNEGANKGILVTTADYGPDAYEFAKGKPITLLSGNELLYLLEKHGHHARINLAEARVLAAERERAESAKA